MTRILKNIINFGYKSLIIFSIIVYIIATLAAIICCVNRSYDYLNPLVLIIGTIIYFLAVFKLYKYIQLISDQKKKILTIILLTAQFILLLLSTFVISSVPKVDLIHILTEINSLNETGSILNNTYYSVYPNNRFLLMLLYSIQKISPQNGHIIFSIVSSLSISIMSIFTYKTVKKLLDDNKALLTLFICVFSPIFYLYVSYYYTDVLMLPISSILTYLIVKTKDEENTKKNIIYGLSIGILSIIGYKIRAIAIFILLAYFAYLLCFKNILKSVRKIIPIFLGLILTLTLVNHCENNFFPQAEPEKEFPMTHWIMMGFNQESNGYYTQTDYEYSSSAKTVDERVELNIKKIQTRIKESGIWGTCKLLLIKIYSIWSKGDYSYQKYLDLVKDYNFSYKYLLEDQNIILNYILQIVKIFSLILCVASLIKIYKKGEKSIISITLFGGIIFYLLWEVCPRYGLSFLPWMIILGTYSYDDFNIDYDKNKLYKITKPIILLVTIILLIFGFFKYTTLENKNLMVAKNTVNKVKYITLNKDTYITQSIKLNNKFNQLKLKFRTSNLDDKGTYKIEIINNKKEKVYEKEFNASELKNDKYTKFKLDKTYKKGNYILKLSSNAESDLEVYVSYKEKFDYYENGKLMVNDKEESGDLMFEITDNRKRRVFTYPEYFIIVVLTLYIEYKLLFRKKENVYEKK